MGFDPGARGPSRCRKLCQFCFLFCSDAILCSDSDKPGVSAGFPPGVELWLFSGVFWLDFVGVLDDFVGVLDAFAGDFWTFFTGEAEACFSELLLQVFEVEGVHSSSNLI